MPKRTASPEEQVKRFWARVTQAPAPACWLWTGAQQRKGYGRVAFLGRIWGAHRLAWFLSFGDIPDRKQVCHRCDNPPCCNPDHLFLGSNSDNVQDMLQKGRFVVGRRPMGSMNRASKLREADIAAIRANGELTFAEARNVARQYGVTPQNIMNIVKRRSWRHVG